MSLWFIYMVRTADNALYTGITLDVARRFAQHQSGKGARALRGKGPLTLAWSMAVGEKGPALQMEYRIKQLTKADKERLARGEMTPGERFPDLPVMITAG